MKTYNNIPDVISAPRDAGDNIPNMATTKIKITDQWKCPFEWLSVSEILTNCD